MTKSTPFLLVSITAVAVILALAPAQVQALETLDESQMTLVSGGLDCPRCADKMYECHLQQGYCDENHEGEPCWTCTATSWNYNCTAIGAEEGETCKAYFEPEGCGLYISGVCERKTWLPWSAWVCRSHSGDPVQLDCPRYTYAGDRCEEL